MSVSPLEHRDRIVSPPQPSKPVSRRKPASRSEAPLHAYEIKGSYREILPQVDLPKGVAVAVIPASASAAAELEKRGEFERTSLVVSPDLMGMKGGDTVFVVSAKIGKSAFEPDARARALLRGVEYAQADLRDAGGAYELEEVRTLLHDVSRQAVDKKVKEGSLLAVPGPSNRRRFPTLQFRDDGSVVPGLQAVQKALNYSSPWSVLNFLVNPQDDLGGAKPIDRLRAGDAESVVSAARQVGVQGG